VGDNATYGGYHNVPLIPDAVYVLYFVVAVAWDGDVKMAFSQLATPVRTAADRVRSGDDDGSTTAADDIPRSAGQSAASSENNDARSTTIMIALIVLFCLLILAVLAAVSAVCWRRRRNAGYHQRDTVVGQTGSDVIRCDIGELSQTSWTPYYSDHFTPTSSLVDSTEYVLTDDHVTGSADKPRDLLVVDIAGYKSLPFADEFRQLPTTDDRPTRTDEETQSHWFLSGYHGRERSYIVTNAPTDATAAFTYWTVIYQEGVTNVVSVGSGTPASATAYQPAEGKECQFGNISVRTTTVRRLSHATSVTFQIRRTDDDALPRRMRQYEFTDWPIVDRVMPSTPLTFVEFVEVVRASSREAQTGANLAPLLVRRPLHDDSGYHFSTSFHFWTRKAGPRKPL